MAVEVGQRLHRLEPVLRHQRDEGREGLLPRETALHRCFDDDEFAMLQELGSAFDHAVFETFGVDLQAVGTVGIAGDEVIQTDHLGLEAFDLGDLLLRVDGHAHRRARRAQAHAFQHGGVHGDAALFRPRRALQVFDIGAVAEQLGYVSLLAQHFYLTTFM